MRAIIWTKYGSPEGLQLQEVEKPKPKSNQVLVQIHASSVTAGDSEMRRLQLPLGLSFPIRLFAGLIKPKRIPVLGQEFAGEVVEVGKDVTKFQIGDQVFGTTGFGFGAYAEYICLPETPGDAEGVLAFKPKNLSYEEAAVVPTAGLEALHYLRTFNIQPGQKVFIIGAGGSIGTFAIQLAKYFGADVIGVDNTDKQELLLSLGVDRAIDYEREDYINMDEKYDIIIDVVGKHSVLRRMQLLKPGGTYYLAFARPFHLILSLWVSITSDKKLKIESASQKKENLEYLAELLNTGKIRSVVDRCFSLDETEAAHRFVESGAKKGNVAITVTAHEE